MLEKSLHSQNAGRVPKPAAILELFKPITWFPPMWAYLCGAISVGSIDSERWIYVLAGVVLAGPLVCGTSQAVNDWYDRHVDALNEPHRVIPSGRMPGQWGLGLAIAGSLISVMFAFWIGYWVFWATLIGIAFAWMYSAPPFRFKQNGWIGNLVVGLSYESLPWLTAIIAATATLPTTQALVVAISYGIGAHGIMTLNDYKAIRGDRLLGVNSLPVLLGVRTSAIVACVTMAVAQLVVVITLLTNGLSIHAMLVGAVLGIQLACMRRFLSDPVQFAVWYSAIGVGLYVSGMMVAAFGMQQLAT